VRTGDDLSLSGNHSVLRYLAAGLLLGFAAAYIARAPLTMGQIAIIGAFGILFLCKNSVQTKGAQRVQSETPDPKVV
jgi:hypothetical protein